MKTKSATSLKNFWLMLTEVPGWPDAPRRARFRRASPVLIPCVVLLILAVWQFAFQAPRIRAERAALEPLIALEDEISSLQLVYSEQEVASLAEQSAVASRLLLDSPDEARGLLRGLKKEAADRGFEASFVSSDVASDPTLEEAVVAYIPVRGKLTPVAANTEPFPALLALLERFGSSGKRIDLMRLSIRADDKNWQAVDLNFRLVCPPVNEKTP